MKTPQAMSISAVVYKMHDYYAPDIEFSMTGEELMTTGLKHTFTGCPDVIIIVFEAE